jgi:hypothetical protein
VSGVGVFGCDAGFSSPRIPAYVCAAAGDAAACDAAAAEGYLLPEGSAPEVVDFKAPTDPDKSKLSRYSSTKFW